MPRPGRSIPSGESPNRRRPASPTADWGGGFPGLGRPDPKGDWTIIPTLGLIVVLGAASTGAASEIAPPIGPSAAPGATAIALPVESGRVAFEVPAELAGGDLFLIISALAVEGPYRGNCSIGPGSGDGAVPDLLAAGREVDHPAGGRAAGRVGPSSPGVIGFVADRLERPSAPGRPPLRRAFAVQARPGDPALPSNYDLVDARLRALGDRLQVFVDEDDVGIVSDEVLRGLVSCFDRVIEPEFSGWIGRPLDVDRDGRFSVLLSSRVGLPYAGRCHVDGYFRSADLDGDLPRPLSNRADLIYLDARLRPGPYLETVLAHEYAHAVIDSRRRERGGPIREDAWLDEAMAHLCEDRVGRSTMNVDYRVGAFLSDPGRYRLVVDDEHRPGLFRSHGNRGAGYLFLRWCADAIDPDLPRTLSTGGAAGLANLERATGLPFAELRRHWAIALALASFGPPREFAEGLDLLDGLGEWPTDGVRFVEIGPDDPPPPFSIEGSGTRFLRLSTLAAGPTRIELRCDPDASIQVTALVPAARVPRLTLELEVVEEGPEAVTVVARVEERAGMPMRLDRLCWEPKSPSPDRPRAALGARRVVAGDLTAIFPDADLGASTAVTSAPFPVPIDEIRSGPLAFRLSARSIDGSRIASWADLGRTPRPGHNPRGALASRPGLPDDPAEGPSP